MANPKTPKIGPRELTRHLREVLAEIRETRLNEKEEIEFVSNARALAELLVKRALGGTEVVVEENEKGQPVQTKVQRKPELPAAIFVWERVEGKVPQAMSEEKAGTSAADKVEELVRQRLNTLAEFSAAGAPPPPVRPPRTDDEGD